ncbi:FliM/FliN family flagellar motor switch protein [Vibrio fluvialis]|uniref:FliM/FliN family flagellar motor switch protein n=1 Tax=Vibrio fluvialis TaxID=676 RepID=UPI0003582D27|nr:FliM/FliN family flagellar motor C-terminal domain-containing protein [Vibrio fluvialis]AVH32640.1 flagellar motor switch protein FliM [Vibrio fluvialis]EKO3407567.1 FliM/FliN family flagellar motor switch protein [Vibrio fluvialis]EKO3535481.1 FliM/FliN family flagellar motor switch protein [Vibrio fluvialis]ELP2652817.1 FliM/FliN family flagellar motor switch protein [Vibrio fluvialis]EMC0408049.1 FliM/FliN family flagellar motor switch protein [Vibrio fluvialis]
MENQIQTPIPEVKTLNVELLGKPIHVIREKLDTIITDSCNGLTSELQNWLTTHHIDVELESVELHSLKPSDIDKSCMTQFRHQDGGALFVRLESSMLIKLADRFYGANIERSQSVLTSSDRRLQERIGKVTTQWVAPQEMWQLHDGDIGSGVGLKAELSLRYADQRGVLTLIMESQLVQTLIDQLDLQPNAELSEQFHRSLQHAPVRLNVLLSKKTMPLSDVLNLAPNDILPIDLLSTVPVSIGNERLFSGRVAEQEGQLVLILNQDKESLR